jgi:hypothetical protein
VSDIGSPEPLVFVVVTGHNFESILPKDHPCHVCFKLADWFQRRRLLNNFLIGPMLKLCPLVKLDVFGMQTFLRGLIYVR